MNETEIIAADDQVVTAKTEDEEGTRLGLDFIVVARADDDATNIDEHLVVGIQVFRASSIGAGFNVLSARIR